MFKQLIDKLLINTKTCLTPKRTDNFFLRKQCSEPDHPKGASGVNPKYEMLKHTISPSVLSISKDVRA